MYRIIYEKKNILLPLISDTFLSGFYRRLNIFRKRIILLGNVINTHLNIFVFNDYDNLTPLKSMKKKDDNFCEAKTIFLFTST